MEKHTSSLLFSYSNKSQYHGSCIPKPPHPLPEATTPGKEGDYNRCDAVSQDTIWKQSVTAERRCLRNWEDNWGFLAEFDAKGNVLEKEELPDKSNMFSADLPNTNSGNYGHRLDSDQGRTMQSLEHKFFSGVRRSKLNSEMTCY